MADHGLPAIETPDCAPWLRQLRSRFPYVQPDHLYYFSRRGMVQLLGRAGYRVEEIRHVGKHTSVRNLVNWLTLYCPWTGRGRRLLRPKFAGKTIYVDLGDIMLIGARPASAEHDGRSPSE